MDRIDLLWSMKVAMPDLRGKIVSVPPTPFTRADILSVKDKGARRKLRKINRLLGFKIW